MRQIKQYWVFILILLTVIGSAALFLFKQREEGQTLRWAHVYEASSPYHQEALRAAAAFEKQTQGRYRILVFPASSLGKETGINEAIRLGSVDMIYTGATLASQDYPPLVISDYPYTIRSYAHWKAYRESQLFDELKAGYHAATGNTIIAPVYYGFRHITANKPILTPKDMKGLKIRVPNSPAFLIMPKAVDANASPMPFAEVYLGLQQGVVDAQENPLPTIKFKRFHEVQSDISLTGHMSNTLMIMVSQSLKDRLDVQDYDMLTAVLREAADKASEDIFAQEETLKDWFEEQGLTIHEPDRDAFRTLVQARMREMQTPFSDEQLLQLNALVPQ